MKLMKVVLAGLLPLLGQAAVFVSDATTVHETAGNAIAAPTPDLETASPARVTAGFPKYLIDQGGSNHAAIDKRAIPATIQNGGTWQYEGCYYDNPKGSSFPVGPIGSSSDGNRTIDNCIAYCSTNGYTTAGIENTYECWCGTGSSTTASQLDNNFCVATCPGNSAQNCGGNPDRFVFYVLNGGVTRGGPLSSSLASVSRASASRASRSSVSSAASASRASQSSVVQASRSSVASVRASLSSVASASRASVISSKSQASISRASARSSVAASRSSVTSSRSQATNSQSSVRSSRSSIRSVATSSKLASISSRKQSLSSVLSASRASVISRNSASLASKLSSISRASASRASVSSVKSVSLGSAASSRSAVSASKVSASSAYASSIAGNVYRAIGCYNHTTQKPALALHPIFTQLSNARCAYKCQKHLYMGLFNGEACWCGDSIMQTTVNFSLCFFGYAQGCKSPGAYTQDCGSMYNMYILGKQSYFGPCSNSDPKWAGKCTPVTAQPFSTTSTTVVAKRTELPAPPVISAAAVLDEDGALEVDEEVHDQEDNVDDNGHIFVNSISDIPVSDAVPTSLAI